MKRKVIAMIILTIGIGFVLYPIIGNIINVMHQNSIQDEYNAMVYNLSNDTKSSIKSNANEYNQKLANGELSIISTDEDAIDKYMSAHRHDTNIDELKTYFDSVIDWADGMFEDTFSCMQSVNWGLLYEKYHKNAYGHDAINQRIRDLMDAETWFTAEEALKFRFATDIAEIIRDEGKTAQQSGFKAIRQQILQGRDHVPGSVKISHSSRKRAAAFFGALSK